MKNIRLEISKFLSNKLIRIICILFFFVAVLDPVSVAMQDIFSEGKLFDTSGRNPFRFWLLLNSVSWGHQVYNTLFWILAVLFTGMIFFHEKTSSMFPSSIIRSGYKSYFCSKIVATFTFPLVTIIALLSINVLVTYIVFPDYSIRTSYYYDLVPLPGTFAYGLYQVHPFVMVFGYVILNALAIAIFSVFTLAIHMLVRFPNIYIAIIAPVIVLFLVSYIVDAFPILFHYNIRLLLQPMAASGLTEILSAKDLVVTFGIWIVIDVILLFLGVRRCREII